MRSDLRTLLRESAPAPREPADVDELFERVDRRRAGRRAATAAGLVAAVAAVVGLAQLVGTQPDIPVIEQEDRIEQSETAMDNVCREPTAGDPVVDDVDLDGDGVEDRVTLHRDGVIQGCITGGGVSAVRTWVAADADEWGVSQSLAPADLGGIGGIVLTIEPGPDVEFHTQNYLLRMDGGELAVVGGPSVAERPNQRGVLHAPVAGWDFLTGDDVDQGSEGSFGVLGCRPSTVAEADFDAIMLFHYPDGQLEAETVSVAGVEVSLLHDTRLVAVPYVPETASREDLDRVLSDAGFTLGCRPAGTADHPDDGPRVDGPDGSALARCSALDREKTVSEVSGAFDHGCGETLSLDVEVDDRLRGQVLAETEIDIDWRGGFFAVASDRAIGGSYSPRSYEQSGAPRMSIFVDGQQVATRAVDQSGPVAFDNDGTLWAWTGSGVAGLRRDGTTADHEVATPPVPTSELPDWMREPEVNARLRVTGTDVSVVFSIDTERSWGHVVPVVGRDPLAGVHTVDSPLPDFGPDWRIDSANILAFSEDTVLTAERLLSGSLLGTVRVELNWSGAPDTMDFPRVEQSQMVADTSASILYPDDFHPETAFLVVHRADGTAAAALVQATPVDQISVSPDGAVHLIARPSPTTAPTVTTLLDADLQPSAG